MKSIFHPMSKWPFIPFSNLWLDHIVKSVEAIIETRRRVKTYLKDRKLQQSYRQYVFFTRKLEEVSIEYIESTIALCHISIVRRLCDYADATQLSRRKTVLLTINLLYRLCLPVIREMEEQHKSIEFLDKTNKERDAIVRSVKECLQAYKPSDERSQALNILILEMTDDQYLSLLLPQHYSKELFSVRDTGPLDGLFSNENISICNKYVASLEVEYNRINTAHKASSERMSLTEMRLLELLDDAIEPGEGDSSAFSSLLFQLCMDEKMHYLIYLRNIKHVDANKDDLEYMMTNTSYMLAADPLFWFIIIFQLLAKTEGIRDDKCAAWVPALMDGLIKHNPKVLKKLKVSAEAEMAKNLLASRLAPFLVGHHPSNEKYQAGNDAICDLGDNKYLHLVSTMISIKMDAANKMNFSNRDITHLLRLYKNIILPNIDNILAWIRKGLNTYIIDGKPGKSLVDIFSEDKTETSGQGGMGESITPVLIETIPEAEDIQEEPLEIKPSTFYYVNDPNNSAFLSNPYPVSDVNALTDYFRTNGISTIIKTESIINAVDYYHNLPLVIRMLMPKEYFRGEPWHKLKRGRLRIFAKMQEDGKTYFYILPRKDWEYNADEV